MKVNVRHAQKMLHEVVEALNKIVVDQVKRRSCQKVAPVVRHFLETAVHPPNVPAESVEET